MSGLVEHQLGFQVQNSIKLEVNKPDAHVHSAVVLTNVEIEVLVLHPGIYSSWDSGTVLGQFADVQGGEKISSLNV